ncbi:MAG: type I restriction enzyme HsdR N-terminal domain-containing protein [Anaerolineaceae bacterium]|nr:type I restriction enzyme HsdR N-terminal domain-containing protein [Anaerolineaceae bacterium]
MGVAEDIRELAASVPQRKRYLRSEEATKNSLVMPFISALGYDIHDPLEVIPEFTADAGVKQHEKVDYAIVMDKKPIILVECKSASTSLDRGHLSQLLRYYAVTDARFGILTNGVVYQFYTDLRKRNVMDEEPFLTVDLRDLDDETVTEVARFAKSEFDAQAIWDLVNTREKEQKELQVITDNIAREFANPSRDLVRILAKGVLGKGYQKPSEWERITNLTKRALNLHFGRTAPVKDVDDHIQPVPDPTPGLEYYRFWDRLEANPELHRLFEALRGQAHSLGDDVRIYATKYHINFARKQRFGYVRVRPQRKLLLLNVRPDPDPKNIRLQDGFTELQTDTQAHRPFNLQITIRNQADLERAEPLIKRSYDEAG